MKNKMLKIFLGTILLILMLGIATAVECGSTPTGSCEVTVNTTLTQGTHSITSYGIAINSNDITLDCNGSILDGGQSITNLDNSYHILTVRADDITIKNCIIQNGNGLKVDGSSGLLDNLVLDGNTFINTTISDFTSHGLSNVTIKNNNFNMESHFTGGGGDDWDININSAGENWIYNNIFNANDIGMGGCGWQCTKDGLSHIYHIYNNTFTHTHGGWSRDVLRFNYMNHSNITGNNFIGMSALLGIEDYSGDDMRIHNTLVYDNLFTWDGIEMIGVGGLRSDSPDSNPWYDFPDAYGNDGTNNVSYCIDGLGNDFQTGSYYEGTYVDINSAYGTCFCGRGGNFYSGCLMLDVDTGHPESSFGTDVIWNDSIILEGFKIANVKITCSNSTAGFSGRGRYSRLPDMEENTTLINCLLDNYGIPPTIPSICCDNNIIRNNTINITGDAESFWYNEWATLWNINSNNLDFIGNTINQINNLGQLHIIESSNLNIVNNSIQNIYLNGGSNVSIIGNEIIGSITPSNIENFIARNNNITSTLGYAFNNIKTSGNSIIEDNNIDGNNTGRGFNIRDGDNSDGTLIIRNNHFYYLRDIYYANQIRNFNISKYNNVSIYNNNFSDSSIILSGTSNTHFYNNTLKQLWVYTMETDICNGGIGNTYLDKWVFNPLGSGYDWGNMTHFNIDGACDYEIPNGITILNDWGDRDQELNVNFNSATISGSGNVGINVTGINSDSKVENSTIENVVLSGFDKSIEFNAYTDNNTFQDSTIEDPYFDYGMDNQFLTLDVTVPVLAGLSPSGNIIVPQEFLYNVSTIAEIDFCNLYINDGVQDSQASFSVNEKSRSVDVTPPLDPYQDNDWYVVCYDVFGNIVISGTQSLFTSVGQHESNDITGLVFDTAVEGGREFVNLAGLIAMIGAGTWLLFLI